MGTLLKTGASVAVLVAGMGLSITAAQAQTVAGGADAGTNAASAQDIVITGSSIRGTAEDAALPVEVIGRQELDKRGTPSMVDLIKSLPFVGAVLGDANQYAALSSVQIGTGSINLRGLGSQRTLVLLNGKRMVVSPGPGSAGVDTQLIPRAAIGRIEILKDGAAAVYGSDAIAGVANFITRTDLDGLEVSADYRLITGSRGDYGGSVAFGRTFDRGNVLLSVGYQHRSELGLSDRRNLITPYLVNPSGYSLLGQPPVFTPRSGTVAITGALRDANCAALGSYAGFSGTTPACYLYHTAFSSVVDREEHFQAYGEVNVDVGATSRFHLEALWAKTILPTFLTSPSFPPLQGPNGPGSVGVFSAPVTNPGVLTALQQAGLTQAQIAATDNVLLNFYRPFGAGGNPLFDDAGTRLVREYRTFRVSAGLKGPLFGGFTYEVSATYSWAINSRLDRDILITRLQQALNGFGGATCAGTVAGANGCLYLNPFSNAYAGNNALGLRNPGYVAANVNSADLANWLIAPVRYRDRQSLFVVDAVINGQVPGIRLPGGAIGFAVGGQFRKGHADNSIGSSLADARLTPCPQIGVTTCPVKTGPFIFRGQAVPVDVGDSIYAAFAELNVPVTDAFKMQAAVRFEHYGGLTGSTVNPKLAAKWQIAPVLALRGSVGTTFRGPTAADRAPVGLTANMAIAAAGNGFKAVDFFGNPAVGPEKATTFNLGAILEVGGLRAIVDYYGVRLRDQITSLPAQLIATSVAGPGSGTQLVNCAAPLRTLITFSNNDSCVQGVTTGNDIQRIRANTTNGPAVRTSGIDATIDFAVPGTVLGGRLEAGAAATYILDYRQAAFVVAGLTVSPAYRAVGFANFDRLPGSLPRYRGNAYVNYSNGAHNLRLTVNHIAGYRDNRTPIFVQDGPSATPCTAASANPPCVPITFGARIGSFTTLDLSYQLRLPWGATISASVYNLLDRDPPAARTEQSFDSLVANALGRNFKMTIAKRF